MRQILPGVLTMVALLVPGVVRGFEDPALTGRNLGMGNISASLIEASAGFFENPALLAPLARPLVGVTYCRPGYAGGNYVGLFGAYDLGRRTAVGAFGLGRFFDPLAGRSRAEECLGISVGREVLRDFGVGVTVKNALIENDTGFAPRFAPGFGLDLGCYYVPRELRGLAAGLVIDDINLAGAVPGLRVGISGLLADLRPLRRPLVGADLVWRRGAVRVMAGVETWLYDRLGLRVGIQGISRPSISIGISLRTNRIEQSDAEVSYAFLTPYADSSRQAHVISAQVALGDARRREKAEARRRSDEEALRAREAYARAESTRAAQAWQELAAEKARLASERADVERLRAEALDALRKVEGIKIQEAADFVRITAEENAINFESGRADLNVPGIKVLKQIARFLATYPNHPVLIEGHTDDVPIGPRLRDRYPDNQALSEARANTIRDYFVIVEELPPGLFTARGLGDTKPVASNASEAGRFQNRRVEITISR